MRASPPVAFSASRLQPRDWCDEFHDFAGALSSRPVRSLWPTIAAPSPLFVQLPHVVSTLPAIAVPSGCDPVRMSCMFGVSPRPLTTSPRSVSAVCLVRLLVPCSSATLLAMTTPLALRHGPVPMRSRALTAGPPGPACVLRYARQTRLPEPAAVASDVHS